MSAVHRQDRTEERHDGLEGDRGNTLTGLLVLHVVRNSREPPRGQSTGVSVRTLAWPGRFRPVAVWSIAAPG